MQSRPLPIGVDNFEKIIWGKYYYADKTWMRNFLFFTGYLRMVSRRMAGHDLMVTMEIPSEEMAYIYDHTIRNWFWDEIKMQDLSTMYQAMQKRDAATFQKELSVLLQKSISYMDGRESFYHGFLLGMLGNMREYIVKSNREKRNRRLDIVVRHPDVGQALVILELKISDTCTHRTHLTQIVYPSERDGVVALRNFHTGYCFSQRMKTLYLVCLFLVATVPSLLCSARITYRHMIHELCHKQPDRQPRSTRTQASQP